MALISCREIWREPRSGSLDERAQRTYRRTFQSITSDPLDGPLVATSSTVIPARYTPYATPRESDWGAFVTRISADQDSENPCVWYVHVDYGTAVANPEGIGGGGPSGGGHGGGDPSSLVENPLDRPPSVSWSTYRYTKAMRDDLYTGLPTVNSAGQPFDPPIERPSSRLVLHYERNVLSFDPLLAADYTDAINEDTFLGFRPLGAKIESFTATREFERLFFYWRVKLEIHFIQPSARDSFQLYVLDAGMYEKVDGKLRAIYDEATRAPVTAPVPLDGMGRRLPEGADHHWIEFSIYERRNFAALGLF